MITHNRVLITCHQDEGNALELGIDYHVPYQRIFHHSGILYQQQLEYDLFSSLNESIVSQTTPKLRNCALRVDFVFRYFDYGTDFGAKYRTRVHTATIYTHSADK